MVKDVKYVVRLEAEERQLLLDLVTKGKRAASVLTRARILLKGDAGAEGPGCGDSVIAEAVETSLSSVHRVRQAFVEEGLEACCTARNRQVGNIGSWTETRKRVWLP